MPSPRLAILGASGFVGSTLCERLFRSKEFDFTPFVHSYGNTSRLSRFPMKPQPVDAMSSKQLTAAIKGYDIVVDLTRGLPPLMPAMTKNLVKAVKATRVKKVVHLSSIAIYGKKPGPESATEAGQPVPDDEYGEAKFRQDEILFQLDREGTPVVMFTPANIYGPYSPFILRAVQYLREGKIMLVNGGHTPTNNVHVENVVEAILASLRTDKGWGERYFVNDPAPTTWAEFYSDMQAILGQTNPLPIAPREPVAVIVNREKPKPRIIENFTAPLSGEFRKGLSAMPAFRAFHEWLYTKFSQSSPEFQERVRAKLAKPTVIQKETAGPDFGNRYVTEQLRSVYHSPNRLATQLGWKPWYDRAQAMESVKQWLCFFNLA